MTAGGRNRLGAALLPSLHNRAVAAVIGGFAFLTLGEWVLGTTVAVHGYAVGGALAVGLVGFRFAPAAAAGLWTTRLADHENRQRVLMLTALARAAATAAAALALALDVPFGIVIAFVWLDAAAGSAYRPAQAALLPSLARTPGELTAATALSSNAKSSGQVIGALIGGVLAATAPIAAAVGAATLLHVAAAAFILGARAPAATMHVADAGSRRSGLGPLLSGMTFLAHEREARLIVFYSCVRSFVRGLWLALAVVASLKLLSLGKGGLGVLMAATATGAALALIATTLLVGSRRLAGWFALGLLLCGAPIAAIGLAAAAAPAILFMVVWGLGMSLADVGAQALLNRIVPGTWIGRVTGAMESAKLLCEGAGSLVAPALLLAFGVRGAVLVAGGVVPVTLALGHAGFKRVDERAVSRTDILELLRRVPFFAPLRVDALEGVAARLRTEHYPAGTEIVHEGDTAGRHWYLVERGQLGVEIDGFVVGALDRGDQFGERSLLRGIPRAATVRAVSDVVLYALERDDFLAAVAGAPVSEASAVAAPEPGTQVAPATALERAPLLHRLGHRARSDLFQHSRVQDVAAGDAVVVKGERDDAYHVLLSGRAQVILDHAPPRELFPGDAFGEIAVLHGVPRTAHVVAREAATVLSIEGGAVRAAIGSYDGSVAAALAA